MAVLSLFHSSKMAALTSWGNTQFVPHTSETNSIVKLPATRRLLGIVRSNANLLEAELTQRLLRNSKYTKKLNNGIGEITRVLKFSVIFPCFRFLGKTVQTDAFSDL